MSASFSNLKRPVHPMPDDIRHALEENGLMAPCRDRPAYQQNDYIGWIERAKREATRQKRLCQMIDELKGGMRYMNMAYRPKQRG